MKALKIELTIYTDDESTARGMHDLATRPQKMEALKRAVDFAERILTQDLHVGAVGISFTEETVMFTELSKDAGGFSRVLVPRVVEG